jgi:hypothetical protein
VPVGSSRCTRQDHARREIFRQCMKVSFMLAESYDWTS